MEPIEISDLKHGDILLYHGPSFVSRAIRFFDNSFYNHASIFMDDGQILEAHPPGVIRQTVPQSIAYSSSSTVTVVRLGVRPADMTPVLRHAETYEGNKYGFEQILLLILICTTRQVRRNNFVARFLRKILDVGAGLLLRMTGLDRKNLICSELVFRAYVEAVKTQPDPYHLVIDGRPYQVRSLIRSAEQVKETDNLISYYYGDGNVPSPENVELKMQAISSIRSLTPGDEEMDELLDDVIDSYKMEDYTLSAAEELELKASLDVFVTAAVATSPTNAVVARGGNIIDLFLQENANFVTPGDFVRSSSLVTIGNLPIVI